MPASNPEATALQERVSSGLPARSRGTSWPRGCGERKTRPTWVPPASRGRGAPCTFGRLFPHTSRHRIGYAYGYAWRANFPRARPTRRFQSPVDHARTPRVVAVPPRLTSVRGYPQGRGEKGRPRRGDWGKAPEAPGSPSHRPQPTGLGWMAALSFLLCSPGSKGRSACWSVQTPSYVQLFGTIHDRMICRQSQTYMIKK